MLNIKKSRNSQGSILLDFGERFKAFMMVKIVQHILASLLLFLLLPGPQASGAADSAAGSEADSQVEVLNLTAEERAFLKKHPVFRVGNEDDWPPFDFSEHGKPKGYAIEHLELLGQHLGISFEYVNGYTWSELLELFKEKRIDILPSLWISEARKQYMLFTEPFLELPYVLVTRKTNTAVHSFQDLQDKIIAVPKGYKQEEVLREHYPEIQLHVVQNPLEGLKAVSFGRADALIGYRGVVNHVIASNFLSDLKVLGEAGVPELGPQGLYIAVRPELPLLRSILQKAMQHIEERKKVQLAQKWINLDQSGYPALNRQERLFLEQNPVLRVDNLQDWPPFNFHENGRAKGFCIDYTELLAEKLNLEIEYVSGPAWSDFLQMIQTGEIDLLSDVVKTKQRDAFIDFTRPYLTIFSGIVIKRGSERYASLEDLAGKTVAVPEKFYYQEILDEYYPEITVALQGSILDCLQAVSSGKVDAALSEKPVFDYLIRKHFLTDLSSIPIMDNIHFGSTPVALGVSKEKTILRDILQKTMDVVSEEEVDRLRQRWLNPEDVQRQRDRVNLSPAQREFFAGRRQITMCVKPDRMPLEGITKGGRYEGIAADMMQILEAKIGVPFQWVESKGWEEDRQLLEQGKCDIVSCVQKTPEKSRYLTFSKSYIDAVNVMVTRSEEPYISSLDALAGKKVGIEGSNSLREYIEKSYPNLTIAAVDDLSAGLNSVSEGKLDAFLGGLQAVSYKIHELGLYELKIAGQTPYKGFFRVGVVKNEPELAGAINTALDSISAEKRSSITQKWLSIKYEHGFNYDLFWKILAGGLMILLGVLYWNRKLSMLNREIVDAHAELEAKSKELERLSITDPLTGIYNRLKLEDVLSHECRRASRYKHHVCVIMLDVDHFKSINDNHGHQAGDWVLSELAGLIADNTREIDTVGRWGGEEFLIICPETERDGAVLLAEKLRKELAGHNFEGIGQCTASFGVAQYQQGQRSVDVTGRADQALYAAKAKGRNRVETEIEN